MSEAGGADLGRFLKFLVDAEDWQSKGYCRIKNADPSEFFLEQGMTAHRVRRKYCNHCEVRPQCLEYGIKTGSTGVWGGEVLTTTNQTSVELRPVSWLDDARPLAHLVDPPPLQEHQIPSFLLPRHGEQHAS